MPVVDARRVLGAGGWLGPTEVRVDDGVITALTPATGVVSDRTIVPGFIDVQVNGINDIDVAHAEGADWDRLAASLIGQGVTSWCPTLVTNHLDSFEKPLQRIFDAQSSSALRGHQPSIIGAHLEGPFLGGAPGAHNRSLIVPVDLAWLAALPPVVRLVTLAAEVADAPAATRLLTERGIVVSIGHSTPSLHEIEQVVAAGAAMATHLFNGMSGVHHRDPGLAAAALVDDRLFVGLIADLVHVHPLAINLAFRSKPDGTIVLVTDAVGWEAGLVGEVRIAIRDGAPRLADGTLAGSSVTMDQVIRNVVGVCGIPLDVAVRAASANPARLMGCSDRGELAVGGRADMVALDDELRIVGVWVGGNQVR